MKTSRKQRASVAWLLYFSLLLASLACAIGHGQMVGLALSGLDGQVCSLHGNSTLVTDLSAPAEEHAVDADCVLCASFAAQLLAAFFGLLALLAPVMCWSSLPVARPSRYAWPPGHPRAPPLFA